MSPYSRPVRSLMALALAVAAGHALADSPYSQTVFFGDSLTDSGYYQPLLPAVVQPVTGRFTTNPGYVWSEFLAQMYGTSAVPNGNGRDGSNYAAGGARVGEDTVGALGPTPSLATQASAYLAASGGSADPNALYSVWGGANDLFAVTAGAPVQATIGSAVAAQVDIIGSLQQAGARYVLVPTIPDLGLTPSFRAQGTAAMAQGTALSSAYNQALFGGLQAAGLQVIPVDTFHLLQEIAADPGAYGFSNITGTACQPQITANSLTCNPTSYATPDASSTYLFADGVHPTTATHRMLAQYAASILEGPRLQQVLTRSAQAIGRARADQVAWHLDGRPQADGVRWWGNLRGDSQRHEHGDLFDGTAPAGLFGVDWARGSWVFGGFAGHGRLEADFGNSRGDFKQTDTTVGAFAGWYGEQLWVNAQVGYSWLDYDVRRQVNLGPARRLHGGSPDGSNLTAALNAGYEFGQRGGLRHGPVASLTWQKVKLDGYVESNPGATALGYGDQDADSTVGRIGWQARFDGGGIKPYLQATYDHEFEDARQVGAWLQSMPEVGTYKVPGLALDRSYATVVLGARTQLGALQTNVGVSASTGQKRARDATVFLNFGGSF